MRPVEELVERIVNASQLPPGKRRREVERELRAHIEDFVEASYRDGRDPEEIERLALANFGDPGQIGRGFAFVYRHERRRRRACAFTLSTLLLASSLLAAVLALQAALAFGIGAPILRMLASRHTMVEALDILASVAFYLGLTLLEGCFESHRFAKAAILLTAIVFIVLGSCAMTGLHAGYLLFGWINGVFCRAVQLFVARRTARLAIAAICFPLAGLALALLRSPVSQLAPVPICLSWLAMGICYQWMAALAARVDAALLAGIERMQASY